MLRRIEGNIEQNGQEYKEVKPFDFCSSHAQGLQMIISALSHDVLNSSVRIYISQNLYLPAPSRPSFQRLAQ